MIKTIQIKHFKGLLDTSISGLSRVNLIGGQNNVGKSSLLEALFLFHDRVNPEMVLRQFAWRGVNAVQFSPDAMWGPIFTNYDMNHPIEISLLDSKKQRETMKVGLNRKYLRKSIQVQSSGKSKQTQEIQTSQGAEPLVALDIEYSTDGKIKQSSHLTLQANTLGIEIDFALAGAKQLVYLLANQRTNPQEDAIRFGQLDVVGKQDMLLEFLKIIEPRIRSLSSIAMGNISLVHADIGLSRKIPLVYMGDGMSRLFSIISSIATSENGILLIDEIENGIHYSVMPKIWEGIAKASRQFNCQVFATTHSYECLTAAHQGCAGEYAADLSYIRLDKVASGITAKNYSPEMLGAAIERGWEVR